VDERIKGQLFFLAEADKMKNVARQTLLADKSREETDAEHSWHFALMAMTLYEYVGIEGVDINRVIKMALLHDLVEVYAGDTFAYDTEGYESKEAREREAADKLFSVLPEAQALEYRSLWEEFDLMETPDALYASAVDRFQPFYSNYLTNGHTWVKHGVSDKMVYSRMAPVKKAMPKLWGFVVDVINDSCEKGYLKYDNGENAEPVSAGIKGGEKNNLDIKNSVAEEEPRGRKYPIVLSEYNPEWPEWFEEEKLNLERAFGKGVINKITHIGSTSVPGMMAKPTIDILLEIHKGTDIEKLVGALPKGEYTCLTKMALTMETKEPHLVILKGYLPAGFAEKVYHIHVRYPGDWDEPYFSGYLISHPEVAAQYAALKQGLLRNFEHDRDGYTEAKTGFIRAVIEEARQS
jgi:putative hydrolase of HD superfamily